MEGDAGGSTTTYSVKMQMQEKIRRNMHNGNNDKSESQFMSCWMLGVGRAETDR